MGQEGSKPVARARPAEQAEGDIPYTSYSVQRQTQEAIIDETDSRPSETLPGDIVVVRSDPLAAKPQERETYLTKLEQTPLFYPLVRSSLNVANTRDLGELDQLNDKQVLGLCLRYQSHLRECAVAVADNQDYLSRRIRDMEQMTAAVFQSMVMRHQAISRVAPQLRAVNDLSRMVSQVEDKMAKCTAMVEELNALLPPKDRLDTSSLAHVETNSPS
ncbi:BLOC-1-related complex subunit 5-like [Sycon ciliatum]|uniref:BLOC-1-related complex subunit 5-like n=1 Tax=Sycon ciliatum TaxID=27933 RepID=UPI0031F60E7B